MRRECVIATASSRRSRRKHGDPPIRDNRSWKSHQNNSAIVETNISARPMWKHASHHPESQSCSALTVALEDVQSRRRPAKRHVLGQRQTYAWESGPSQWVTATTRRTFWTLHLVLSSQLRLGSSPRSQAHQAEVGRVLLSTFSKNVAPLCLQCGAVLLARMQVAYLSNPAVPSRLIFYSCLSGTIGRDQITRSQPNSVPRAARGLS